MRIRGGTQFKSDTGKWHAIAHCWDNGDGEGEADHMFESEPFDTESEAMTHYTSEVKPLIVSIFAEAQKNPGVEVEHNAPSERLTMYIPEQAHE